MFRTDSKLFKIKYDFIFSIGEACSCTQSLRAVGLQNRSFPFDWVYKSTLMERTEMIQNNFQNWLSENAMEHLGERLSNNTPRNVYRNKLTGVVFNHDFPAQQALEKSYPAVEAKYNRRIARLYSLIRSSQNVLVVFLSAPNTTNHYSTEQIIQSEKTLSECFPGVNIHLLHIVNNNDITLDNAELRSLSPNCFSTSFCYNAFDKEVTYRVNFDPLKKFFKNIQLSNKHTTLMDRLNRWSLNHSFLNHIVRWRRNRNLQIFELFRIKLYSYKINQH